MEATRSRPSTTAAAMTAFSMAVRGVQNASTAAHPCTEPTIQVSATTNSVRG